MSSPEDALAQLALDGVAVLGDPPEEVARTITELLTPDPPRLSYSSLSSFAKCHEAYRLQHVVGAEVEESGAALAGTAIHDLIEELVIGQEWWRRVGDPELRPDLGVAFALRLGELLAGREVDEDGNVTWTPKDPEAIRWGGRQRIRLDDNGEKVQARGPAGELLFRESVTKAGALRRYPVWEKAGEDVHWWLQQGPLMLLRAAAMVRRWEDAGIRVEKARVEVKLTAWLVEPGVDPEWPLGLRVTGRIDLMLLELAEGEHPDPETGEILPGASAVVDWKSGSYIDPWQLVVYAWLLGEVEGPLRRMVRRGMIAYLRGNDAEAQEQWHEFTDEQVAFVRDRFLATARALAASPDPQQEWLHMPSSWCGSCWVRKACRWWQINGTEE